MIRVRRRLIYLYLAEVQSEAGACLCRRVTVNSKSHWHSGGWMDKSNLDLSKLKGLTCQFARCGLTLNAEVRAAHVILEALQRQWDGERGQAVHAEVRDGDVSRVTESVGASSCSRHIVGPGCSAQNTEGVGRGYGGLLPLYTTVPGLRPQAVLIVLVLKHLSEIIGSYCARHSCEVLSAVCGSSTKRLLSTLSPPPGQPTSRERCRRFVLSGC